MCHARTVLCLTEAGQLTTCFINLLSQRIQPFVFALLTQSFAPADVLPNMPIVHSPKPAIPLLLGVGSHMLTGLALSPLDLVRTRLIAQSSQARHRSYSGPIDALRTIAREEGGYLNGLFLHANLLLPAILDCTIRPLVHLASPLIIERALRISAVEHPVQYGLADFVLSSAGLLFVLPFETVRRRLQVQSRATTRSRSRAFRTCVETRPEPYAGVVEAVYRIVSEETGSVPRRLTRPPNKRRKSEQEEKADELVSSGLAASSVRQLYRGLGMGLAAHSVVFCLSLLTGGARAEYSEM